MFKRILSLFLSLISFAIISNAYALTIDRSHVTITNNTNESVTISVNLQTADPDFKKGNQWDETSMTLEPYQSKEVLWFARNVGVKKNTQYDFSISASNVKYNNEVVQLGFHVKGIAVYGSDIATDLTLPTKNRETILSSDGLYKFPAKYWGGDAIVHARTSRSLGHLFNDYQFVIDKSVPVSISADRNTELSVLTYNTQLMPFYADGVDDLNEPKIREKDIPAKIANYDVVMMEELFDRDLRSSMISDMTKYYPYHTTVVGFDTSLPLTGGVMIFSKWPIEKEDQIIYTDSTGSDRLAAKGVGYGVINKNGKRYHLFATHTDAGYKDADMQARQREFNQFDQFIQSKNIPENEPVILGGDFNVDEFSTEIQTLLASLHVTLLENKGFRYSNDGLTNLMNNDKERVRLDYVFASKQHAQPKSAYNQVFVLRALDDEKKWPKFELSDHYPVAAYFDFG